MGLLSRQYSCPPGMLHCALASPPGQVSSWERSHHVRGRRPLPRVAPPTLEGAYVAAKQTFTTVCSGPTTA